MVESKDQNLVSGERRNIQLKLAFSEEIRGEAPKDSGEGTEPLAATTNTDGSVKLVSLMEEVRSWSSFPHQPGHVTQPNRRGTDPYARWCGRGEAAKLPLSRFEKPGDCQLGGAYRETLRPVSRPGCRDVVKKAVLRQTSIDGRPASLQASRERQRLVCSDQSPARGARAMGAFAPL